MTANEKPIFHIQPDQSVDPSLKIRKFSVHKIFVKEFETLLRNNKRSIVHYTKVNGDYGEMACTLSSEILPKRVNKTDDKPKRAKNDNVIVVWNCDKNAWRSMLKENICSIEVVKENE